MEDGAETGASSPAAGGVGFPERRRRLADFHSARDQVGAIEARNVYPVSDDLQRSARDKITQQ